MNRIVPAAYTVMVLLFAFQLNAQKVDVYLLAGQSNMQGVGAYSDLTPEEKLAPENVFFWNGKSFEAFVPTETLTAANPKQFGPELGFARAVSGKGRSVYLVKYHASGMPLHHGFDGGKWLGGEPMSGRRNFYPGNSANDPRSGKLYLAMITKFKKAIAALESEGKSPQVRGLVWMQGEQDSKQEVSANHYGKSLKRLRQRIRNDLGLGELPLAFGKVLPHEPGLPRFTHREQIRAQMAAADMASGFPEAMVKTRCVDTSGMGLLRDMVHFNAQGNLQLGKALASGLQQAIQAGEVFSIWDGTVAGFPADYKHVAPQQPDGEHVTEVTQATISVFRATEPNENRASVVIFPGGGYRVLADLKEGDRVAAFLAEKGFTSFVVRYRVSKSNKKSFQFPGPLYDARQAIRILKSNSEKFNIDPEKLGVMGFSAGGHLASMAATRFDDEIAGEVVPGAMQGIGVRPAFAALIYPVATMFGPTAHGGSKRALFGESPSDDDLIAASADHRMTPNSPPLFLVHTEFDPVDSLPTLKLAVAAKEAKVGCELHLYPTGGHGYGMKRPGDSEMTNPVIAWPELLVKFLKRQ